MTVKIDTDAVINNIFMTDQGSNPSTPSAGKTRIFSKADGIYIIDDDGLAIGPLTPSSGWAASKLTWTWNSSNDPSYVIETNSNVTGSFSAGMRFKINDTSTKMFIITKVAFAGSNTQLTMYGGTDYDLTSGTLTSPYYSTAKSPIGFPLDPTKWTVEVTDTSNRSQATPTQNVWYNLGTVSITIPIGAWRVSYHAALGVDDTNVATISAFTTLSTANNSESDADFTSYCAMTAPNGGAIVQAIAPALYREKYLVLASSTVYYLNTKTSFTTADNIYNLGANSKTIIRAVCAYL